MTGAFLTVNRAGQRENLEVEYLTDDERVRILGDDDRAVHWLNLVCKKLNSCEELLNELAEEGILTKEQGE